MAADIVNTIIDKIIQEYPAKFNAGLTTSDPLYLRSIIKNPLQDDPIVRAFYLAVGPDFTMQDPDTHWRMPVQSVRKGKLGIDQERPEIEVGGGYRMINFFIIEGWLPFTSTREQAHDRAGKALRKLEQAFSQMTNSASFRALSTDDGLEYTNAGAPQVFGNDGSHYKITGGDAEWYPRVQMRFHIYTEIRRDYWK